MIKLLRGVVHNGTIQVTDDLGMLEGKPVELLLMPSNARESMGDEIIQIATKLLFARYGRQGADQATDWLGKKLLGYKSKYYTKVANISEIEDDRNEAIKNGDKEATEELTVILDRLRKQQLGS